MNVYRASGLRMNIKLVGTTAAYVFTIRGADLHYNFIFVLREKCMLMSLLSEEDNQLFNACILDKRFIIPNLFNDL
ncbi:hypothetical protein M8C21_005381 [Ambrosia artemisiifolia]|uniref:Uncharacterized protein n=1 Tax=Ambrosia artemisiifolia TaxID=4212 RepID=A0AAD5BM22_AMBAR|nr:hypothetical protein M8C21_005381 [Ambrosia artemisiifolia]